MAWTFDVFAFIPACFLLSILTLVFEVASQTTACETCVATAAGGNWCQKTYIKSEGNVEANFCLPKGLTADSCLGGAMAATCPKAPFHLNEDYSARKPEPQTCTKCQEATGKWCKRGPDAAATTTQVRFCIPLAKEADCATAVTATGESTALTGEIQATCTASATTESATAVVGESATDLTCGACIDGSRTWCLKDYGDGKPKASYCVVTLTPGICLGGTKITAKGDCPTVGKDRRVAAPDVADCKTCIDTHKQKYCLKGKAGAQFRACVPKDDVGSVCTTNGGTAPDTCDKLSDVEKKATAATLPTEAPKTTAKPVVPATTTTKKAAASTVGVLTASVLAAVLVAAT